MDPDEIVRLVEEMKLSSADPTEILNLDASDIRIGEERISRCLVAKVFSSKAVNREAFRTQMPKILQSERKIDIEVMGDNTFVFEFYSLRDRSRALKGGPWNFFQSLIIFQEPTGWQNPRFMKFDEITIWTQLHNIPLALLHEDLLLKLGRQIGHVVDLDRGETGAFLGRFARIRVRINISQPLKKCIRISAMREKEDIIILLVYERLPDFCYACGKLGHSYRECDDESVNGLKLAYGSWMRASAHTSGRKGTKDSSPKFASGQNEDSSQEADDQQGVLERLSEIPKNQFDLIRAEHSMVGQGRAQNLIVNEVPNIGNIKNPTETISTIREALLDARQIGGEKQGIGLDEIEQNVNSLENEQVLLRSPKQWKRRARTKGKKILAGLEPQSYTGSKILLSPEHESLSHERTSPLKKKQKVWKWPSII